MTLAETLLSKLAEPRPTSSGRFVLAHSDAVSGWSVALTIEKADALSCQLSEVSCVCGAAEPPALRKWADVLAERVTGLLEPLQVIEVDLLKNEAILRSDEPTVKNQKRAHYELKLEGGVKATLRRYQAAVDPSAKRQSSTFVLTHEVLGNLIDDLTGPVL
jgi:hypothetical protein